MAYVNVRSGRDVISDPYAGEFGAMPDASTILAAIAPCAARAVLSAEDGANCLWDQVAGIVLSSPDAEVVLGMIMDSDYATALAALGLPGEVVSAVGMIPGLGSIWTKIQRKAHEQFIAILYARGTDRPAAEGGGHSLVSATGEVGGYACSDYAILPNGVAVGFAQPGEACPSGTEAAPPAPPAPLRLYATRMRKAIGLAPGRITGRVVDASGAPVFGAEIRVGSLRNPVASRTGADGAFAVTTTPTVPTHVYVSAKGYASVHVAVTLSSGGAADAGSIVVGTPGSGDQDLGPADQGYKAAKPWYKRTNTWLVAGGVIVAGGVAIAVARKGSR